jgi:hypothetical protein
VNDVRSRLFVLNSNVFIEAHRRFYPLDLCPGFWECIAFYCEDLRLISIDRVRSEILDGDALSEWVEGAPLELFASSAEPSIVANFASMMSWVGDSRQFQSEAQDEFARAADGWLAAFAKANNAVLVTHETYNPAKKRRVPLPNVCRQFGVDYCDTFTMLRELEVRFGWLRS